MHMHAIIACGTLATPMRAVLTSLLLPLHRALSAPERGNVILQPASAPAGQGTLVVMVRVTTALGVTARTTTELGTLHRISCRHMIPYTCSSLGATEFLPA
jgi:hypothetical protein